jgi:hypothetical protein
MNKLITLIGLSIVTQMAHAQYRTFICDESVAIDIPANLVVVENDHNPFRAISEEKKSSWMTIDVDRVFQDAQSKAIAMPLSKHYGSVM